MASLVPLITLGMLLAGCPEEAPPVEPCIPPVADFFPLTTSKGTVTIAGTKDVGLDGTAVWLQLNTWDEPRPTSELNKNTDWAFEVELEEGANEFVLLQETSQGFCPDVVFGESKITLDSQAPVFCRALDYPKVVLVEPDVESVSVEVSGDREEGAAVQINGRVAYEGLDVAWSAEVDVVQGMNEFTLVCEDSFGNATAEKTFTIEGSTGDPPSPPAPDAYESCVLLQETDGYKTVSITGAKAPNTTLYVDGEVRGSDGFYEADEWVFSFDAFRGQNCYELSLKDDLDNLSELTQVCVKGGFDNVTAPLVTAPASLSMGTRYYLTNETGVEIRGSKGVGTNVIFVAEDGSREEIVAVDYSTAWSVNYDFEEEGVHAFSLVSQTAEYDAADPCGEESLVTTPSNVEVDVTPPARPNIDFPVCLTLDGNTCDLGELFVPPGAYRGTARFFGEKEASCQLLVDGEVFEAEDQTYDFYGETGWSFVTEVDLGTGTLALTCLDDAGNLSEPLVLNFEGVEGLLPPTVSYVGGQAFSWPSALNPYPLDIFKGSGEKVFLRFDDDLDDVLLESCFLKPQDSLLCPSTATGLTPATYYTGVCAQDYSDYCIEDDDCDGPDDYCLNALSATTLCHCMIDIPAEQSYELYFHVENEATGEYSAETDPVRVTLDQTPPSPVSCVVGEGVCAGDDVTWCEQTDVRSLNLVCTKEPFANACVRVNQEPACMSIQAYNARTSFEVEIDIKAGLNQLVFVSQDIAGNLAAPATYEISSVAGPEITLLGPVDGEVVHDTSFTVDVSVDAQDSTIAEVEYCFGDSLTDCVYADCGEEPQNTATCSATVELGNAVNGLPYEVLVRVANAANVQSERLMTLLYLDADLILSDEDSSRMNDNNALHARNAKILFDDEGVLHFVWLDDCMGSDACPFAFTSNSFPSDVFYRRWDADGWSDDIIISDGVDGAVGGMVDSFDVAIDSSGDLHFVWSSTTDRVADGYDSTDKDLYHRILRKNADRPETNLEGIPLVRAPAVEIGENEQKDDEMPSLFVDASDNVHLVWRRTLVEVNTGVCSENPWMNPYDNPDTCTFLIDRTLIKYAYFDSSNQSWSVNRDLSNGTGTASHPSIVGNETGTTLYVVWQDNMPGAYTTSSSASPANLVGGDGSGFEFCLQSNLTARDVLSIGTPSAEGLSCDSILMRLIRLEVDAEAGTVDYVPEMEGAPSNAARLYLVSTEINHQNNRFPTIAAGVQGSETGEAMEIVWRATENDTRVNSKAIHRTFNPAGLENGLYFSGMNVLGENSDLGYAQDVNVKVDQSTGVIYAIWIDGIAPNARKLYTSRLDLDTSTFEEPALLMDGLGRKVASPDVAIDPGKTVYYVWDQEEFIDGATDCELVYGEDDPCRYEIRFFAEGAVQGQD